MVKWYSGKRKWYLAIAVAVITVVVAVLAFGRNQEKVSEHMYPQDTIYKDSNISVRGVVASIEQDYRSAGLGSYWEDCYHIFRYYIKLNITETVWADEDLAGFSSFSAGKSIGIGYDNLDDLTLSIGQVVECRGYYLPLTDSPYSFKITVAPSVSESYLEPE